MPPKKGWRKNPLTGKFGPPEKATPVAPASEPANDQIRDLLAPGGEDEFAASLPESTVTTVGEEQPRKKYARKPKVEEFDNPLMADPEYRQAIQEMQGLGGAEFVRTAFFATGKPLDDKEAQSVKNLFVVVGKRSKLDPGESWFVLGLYAFFLLCRLVVMRTDVGAQLSKLFDPPQPQAEEKKEEPVN